MPRKHMIFFSILSAFLMISGFFLGYFGVLPGFDILSPFMIMMIAGLSFVPFVQYWGKPGIYVIFMLGLTGFIIEFIAIKTCVPYGCFGYSDNLGIKILDTVPWTVFFARSPLVLGVHTIINTIDTIKKQPGYIRYFIGACMLVACDLVLDPGAVHNGFWTFVGNHRYYNVPRVNYLGRVITGYIGMREIQYRYTYLETTTKKKPQYTNIFTLAMYSTLIFWTTYTITAGLVIPAIIGVLLIVSYLFWRHKNKDQNLITHT